MKLEALRAIGRTNYAYMSAFTHPILQKDLLAAIEHPDPRVQSEAALKLNWHPEPRPKDWTQLMIRYASHPNRAVAISALEHLYVGNPEEKKALIAATEHAAGDVRAAAYRTLLEFEATRNTKSVDLISRAIRDPSPEVALVAILKMGRQRDRQTRDFLIQAAARTEVEVYKEAIYTLSFGFNDDKKAVAAFIEAAKSADPKKVFAAARGLASSSRSEAKKALQALVQHSSSNVRDVAAHPWEFAYASPRSTFFQRIKKFFGAYVQTYLDLKMISYAQGQKDAASFYKKHDLENEQFLTEAMKSLGLPPCQPGDCESMLSKDLDEQKFKVLLGAYDKKALELYEKTEKGELPPHLAGDATALTVQPGPLVPIQNEKCLSMSLKTEKKRPFAALLYYIKRAFGIKNGF